MSYTPLSYATSEAPVSTTQLADRAADFDYDPEIPLKYWLRTTATLLREAEIYDREENDEQAYLLLVRHANLVLDHLPQHAEARVPENARALKTLKKNIPDVLARLEELKPIINHRHDTYQANLKTQRQRQKEKELELQRQAQQYQQRKSSSVSSRSRTDSIASSSSTYSSRDYNQYDERRPSTSRQKIRISEEDKWRDSTPSALRPGSQRSYSSQKHFDEHGWSYETDTPNDDRRRQRRNIDEGEDLQSRIQNLHLSSEIPLPPILQAGLQGNAKSRPPTTVVEGRKASYPSVPKRTVYREPPKNDYTYDLNQFRMERKLERVPTRPPKIQEGNQYREDLSYAAPPVRQPSPPLRPGKSVAIQTQPLAPPKEPANAAASYQFECVAHTESRQPLRTIFLPEGLSSKFLSIAASNTRKNLETCGILCGFLKQNALFINRLVIPEQEATSDTCATTDEAGLFNYVDGEDLLVLGWIHTHPTQTCFMSSVDLHTHCSYQLMLAESIAIVCAPKHDPMFGIFRLTDPPGIKTITSCRQEGLFHPHSGNIYTDAMRPGHVCEVREMGFGVVDLRSGSK